MSSDQSGFLFDLSLIVQKLQEDSAFRKPWGRRSFQKTGVATECMRSFIEEYVRKRRWNMRVLRREQKFPVVG